MQSERLRKFAGCFGWARAREKATELRRFQLAARSRAPLSNPLPCFVHHSVFLPKARQIARDGRVSRAATELTAIVRVRAHRFRRCIAVRAPSVRCHKPVIQLHKHANNHSPSEPLAYHCRRPFDSLPLASQAEWARRQWLIGLQSLPHRECCQRPLLAVRRLN